MSVATRKYSRDGIPNPVRALEILAESIANGTHSAESRHVCEACREWCGGIYYIGFTGTRMCAACADKIGMGPIADEARRRK